MSTMATTLLLPSEEEVLIESTTATKQEYWLDDVINEWRQLSPLLDDDDVAAGSSGDHQAAAAESNGFWDELQELPPLDADDDVMNNGDHDDEPFSTNGGVAASCSDQAAATPLPSAAAGNNGAAAGNNGFLAPDHHHPAVQYYDQDHLQVNWRGLGGANELGGGFGHHHQGDQVARLSTAGAINPTISRGFNIPPPPIIMLHPSFSSSYTQYSGSTLNITTHQDQNYFVDYSTPTSHHDHNSPWPAHQQPQSWDQIMSFPNSTHHHSMEVMVQPIGIPTPIPIPSSSTNANGVGENHHQQRQKKKKHERWTVEEHKNMLRGIMKYGKGNWKSISREFVSTKSAVQIASHAQKLEARQKENKEVQEVGIGAHRKKKRRSSIHDVTIDPVDPAFVSSDN